MMNNYIEEEIKKIIILISENIKEENINYETNLVNDLNFDSVDIFMLVSNIEEKFNFEFNDDELVIEVLASFEALVKTVDKHFEERKKY